MQQQCQHQHDAHVPHGPLQGSPDPTPKQATRAARCGRYCDHHFFFDSFFFRFRFRFLFLSSGGWGKIKLKLITLPRIFLHVMCQYKSIVFAIQR